MAASVEYVWKTGSKLLRRWLIKLLRKKKLPKDTQWIAGNIINRQWFWCFVQVLNYKVIHLLWRDYRTSNHHFVSISSYSRITFPCEHDFGFWNFLSFFLFTSKVTSERMWCGSCEHMSPNPTMASSSPQSAACSRWNRADSRSHSLSFSQKRPASW